MKRFLTILVVGSTLLLPPQAFAGRGCRFGNCGKSRSTTSNASSTYRVQPKTYVGAQSSPPRYSAPPTYYQRAAQPISAPTRVVSAPSTTVARPAVASSSATAYGTSVATSQPQIQSRPSSPSTGYVAPQTASPTAPFFGKPHSTSAGSTQSSPARPVAQTSPVRPSAGAKPGFVFN